MKAKAIPSVMDRVTGMMTMARNAGMASAGSLQEMPRVSGTEASHQDRAAATVGYSMADPAWTPPPTMHQGKEEQREQKSPRGEEVGQPRPRPSATPAALSI